MLVTGYWLLVTGYWLLVTGCWLLVAGCWSLVAGCWLLVAGCWSLVAGRWLLVAGAGCCTPFAVASNQPPATSHQFDALTRELANRLAAARFSGQNQGAPLQRVTSVARLL